MSARVVRLVPGLAMADLRHEWILTLCLVIAVAAVVAPLLILQGLKHGTVATLRELRAQYGDSELFLIIGRDLVDDFASWHESSEIEKLATIVVVERPGCHADPPRGWYKLLVPPTDTSSTELRELLRSRPTDSFSEIPHLSPAVVKVIQARGVYHRTRSNIQAVQNP